MRKKVMRPRNCEHIYIVDRMEINYFFPMQRIFFIDWRERAVDSSPSRYQVEENNKKIKKK